MKHGAPASFGAQLKALRGAAGFTQLRSSGRRGVQRILDHRGTDPFSPFHAVASLGLARARALAGDVVGSLEAYERFSVDGRRPTWTFPCWSSA